MLLCLDNTVPSLENVFTCPVIGEGGGGDVGVSVWIVHKQHQEKLKVESSTLSESVRSRTHTKEHSKNDTILIFFLQHLIVFLTCTVTN